LFIICCHVNGEVGIISAGQFFSGQFFKAKKHFFDTNAWKSMKERAWEQLEDEKIHYVVGDKLGRLFSI